MENQVHPQTNSNLGDRSHYRADPPKIQGLQTPKISKIVRRASRSKDSHGHQTPNSKRSPKPSELDTPSKLQEATALDNLKFLSSNMDFSSRFNEINTPLDDVTFDDCRHFTEPKKRNPALPRKGEIVNTSVNETQLANQLTNESIASDTEMPGRKPEENQLAAPHDTVDVDVLNSNVFTRVRKPRAVSTDPNVNTFILRRNQYNATTRHSNQNNSFLSPNSRSGDPKSNSNYSPHMSDGSGFNLSPQHKKDSNSSGIPVKIGLRTPDKFSFYYNPECFDPTELNKLLVAKKVFNFPARSSKKTATEDQSKEILLSKDSFSVKHTESTEYKPLLTDPDYNSKILQEKMYRLLKNMSQSPKNEERTQMRREINNSVIEQPFERLHSKKDRITVVDAYGFRRPNNVPPQYQKLSSALKQLTPKHNIEAQKINWDNLVMKSKRPVQQQLISKQIQANLGSIETGESSQIQQFPSLEKPSMKNNKEKEKLISMKAKNKFLIAHTSPSSIEQNETFISAETRVESSYLQLKNYQASFIKEVPFWKSGHRRDHSNSNFVETEADESKLSKPVSPLPQPIIGKKSYQRKAQSVPKKREKSRADYSLENMIESRKDQNSMIEGINYVKVFDSFNNNLDPMYLVKNLQRNGDKSPVDSTFVLE